MSTVNLMAREVAAKIVFYGPGLSGKTTTLAKIYQTVKPAHRGEMMSLPTESDRTLFFDFLPVKVERVGDCNVRLALYTVPGQVFYNATRKLVLQGADGVVFVADSQPAAMDSNRESLRNLEENLLDQGIRLERFPLVLQYNKRDAPNAMSVAMMREALNPRGCPEFETSAPSGRGVIDTLKAITRLVIKDLRTKRVVPSPRPTAPVGLSLSGGGAEMDSQIQQHLDSQIEQEVAPMASPAFMPSAFPAVAVTESNSEPLGPAAALAPPFLLDYAKAADAAFRSEDLEGCLRACQEAIRLGMGLAGEGSLVGQGYLLGVSGPDLLRVLSFASRSVIHRDDAAFALYVMMQVFVRLSASGLPTHE